MLIRGVLLSSMPSKKIEACIYFLITGAFVFSLSLFAFLDGGYSAMVFIAMTMHVFIPLLLVVLLFLSRAIILSLKLRPRNRPLFILSLASIPYSILALDNMFYFFRPLVIDTNAIIIISLIYSFLCVVCSVGVYFTSVEIKAR